MFKYRIKCGEDIVFSTTNHEEFCKMLIVLANSLWAEEISSNY